MPISRRDLLASSTAIATAALPISATRAEDHRSLDTDRWHDGIREPDSAAIRTGSGEVVPLVKAGGSWTTSGTAITAQVRSDERGTHIPVVVESERADLAYLHLRWSWHVGSDALVLGDAWERAYGDLRWECLVPERIIPWYFVKRESQRLTGFGVETQPSAFCFWQCDREGVSLWIDLRNGGEPALLAGRPLTACRVVMTQSRVTRAVEPALQSFCERLCPSPRLPRGPIVGSNDWNYAYGKNTASGILRDARLMVELAPAGYRPFVVIDDGWQDKTRFPDLSNLAASIRAAGARPGIWIRPLRAEKDVRGALLPPARFGSNSAPVTAYDPSVASGLEAALFGMRQARQQGFEFIKHDFSTYDLLGQWGREMGPQPALPGWHFADRSRTTAEIVLDFYRALRREAGDDCVILGCNTFGHLTAGLFESQRIADDTSGQAWERTRRFGVNGLSFRIAQHRAFYHADPDIVAVTESIPWSLTSQWLEVVARSGTSLFVAPQPEAITPAIKAAIRSAMAIAVTDCRGYPLNSTSSTTPEEWRFDGANPTRRAYRWCEALGADAFM